MQIYILLKPGAGCKNLNYHCQIYQSSFLTENPLYFYKNKTIRKNILPQLPGNNSYGWFLN